jgi:hypothetical protein
LARGDEWNLPWNSFYWDITPKVPSLSVNSDITVNSVVHTDQHVKLRVPTAFPVTGIVVIANATELSPSESMTVVVILDAPDNWAVTSTTAEGGQLSATTANVVAGQWVYFNISSTVSTFFGQIVNLKVDFITPTAAPSFGGHHGTFDADPIRPRGAKIGAIVGGTIGGVVVLVALVSCCVCLGRKQRRARMARMAMPSPPSSGEPSMYLPPAY